MAESADTKLVNKPAARELAEKFFDRWGEHTSLAYLLIEGHLESLILEAMMIEREVYAVCFGNYFPAEIDSLWPTAELAEERAEKLSGDWEVRPMTVYGKLENAF